MPILSSLARPIFKNHHFTSASCHISHDRHVTKRRRQFSHSPQAARTCNRHAQIKNVRKTSFKNCAVTSFNQRTYNFDLQYLRAAVSSSVTISTLLLHDDVWFNEELPWRIYVTGKHCETTTAHFIRSSLRFLKYIFINLKRCFWRLAFGDTLLASNTVEWFENSVSFFVVLPHAT